MTSDVPEAPDLRYSINPACCEGLGYKGEFEGAATKTGQELTDHNESVWGFSNSALPFHGLAHSIVALCAAVDPCNARLRRFIEAPIYQGDMEGEAFVLSTEEMLNFILSTLSFKHSNQDTVFQYDGIHNLLRKYVQNNIGETLLKTRHRVGSKSSFLLARQEGEPPFHIRARYGFEDYDIPEPNLAESMALKDGDTFIDKEKVCHTYRELPDIMNDPGYQLLVQRIAAVLSKMEPYFKKADSGYDYDLVNHITGQDIVQALIDGCKENGIPLKPSPHFMREFGMPGWEHGAPPENNPYAQPA